MARISYLIRRGASYSARIKVPLDLVEAIGKTEIVKALGTKDEGEAKRRLWPVIQSWNRQFEEARSRRALTEDDKADAVWQHYVEGLDLDEAARRRLPTGETIEAASRGLVERIERDEVKVDTRLAEIAAVADVAVLADARQFDQTSRRAKLATLRDHMASGETALIDDEAEAYIEKHKLLVDPASDDGRDLARRLMRAEIEKLARTLERDRGDYAGTPRDPIVKPPLGTAREVAAPGETIVELFEKYARQNPKGIKVDTLNQARRDIGTFLDLHGSTLPAHRIDKKGVAAWIDLLMVYPVKATETKAFEGMTFPQIIRANERVGKPVLSPRTVNRYLAGLGAFCDWLVRRGILDANPTEGLSLAKQKRKGDPTFSTDQMVTLFQSPLFVGCESGAQPRYYSKPGPTLIRDFRYWVPLVMLYSGARPGEIAQLLCSDVRTQDGVWFMHITTLGDDDKSVKTGGSMRIVPIHSELIRLGFLDYHERMVKAKERKLFPTAERNSRGQMIADFSRDFGRYLTKLGIKNGRGLSLYSFRHGAVDALRRSGYLDESFGFILGHARGGTTGLYGIVPQGMLKQRLELVEAIRYPDLSIEHLMPPQPA